MNEQESREFNSISFNFLKESIISFVYEKNKEKSTSDIFVLVLTNYRNQREDEQFELHVSINR